jgi:hypothetical protein
MEKAKLIKNLRLQVQFSLDVAGVHICNYRPDFVYETPDGQQVVEDTKGVMTREYITKKRLMLAVWNITVIEPRVGG